MSATIGARLINDFLTIKIIKIMQNGEQDPFFTNIMLLGVPIGFKVEINDMACISKEWKQFKFPKSKKVRIKNKWSKCRVNFRMQVVHRVIRIQNKLIVSSLIFERLKENKGIGANIQYHKTNQ